MKRRTKIFFLFLILFFFLSFVIATAAYASPYLVADAPPAEQQITSYKIYKNAVFHDSFDGETLNYDLMGVVPGAYDWTAEACNVWGCSAISDPYISPSAAGPPLNLNAIP